MRRWTGSLDLVCMELAITECLKMTTCPTAAQSPGGWSALTSMPGWFKKAWYGLASLLSFSSFLLIIVALAVPHWLSGKILCQTGVDLVNATDPELVKFIGDIYYGLFRGCKIRQCGLGGRQSQFTSEYVSILRHVNWCVHFCFTGVLMSKWDLTIAYLRQNIKIYRQPIAPV